ncbi:cysteine-rich receptor-like protein kinase 44 isoform X1 [Lolium rigidum]|uniref:cysteine-rich receptor-like protein kinase 44 isoform X1 n=1 Tax=Lolium rigidum TaxID=89674 RepID=UPI001F5C4D5E|nr:cysteine-rich receptor-like protein kinase 44 isoform X1 [Lolium rigidum]
MEDASVGPTVVPLDFLREITNGFAEEQELGSGSFGKVYLGVCPDGEKVAVKKLYDMPGLDDKQFLNEFNNLRRVQHKNIVRLVGYCRDIQEVHVMYQGKLVLAEKTHRALCLEYISNGSLDKYLSEECDRYNWQTCYRIIKGICQGLKYLHNELKPPIYHLDLKPANILLDENMVPRIADFGISRFFGDEHTRVTKSTLGTLGYSPPEFIRSNLISNKFDIFSFGVVIIKMMAGRSGYWKSTEMSSHEFTNLVQENWTSRLLETSNRRNAYSEQIKICIEIGLCCVQEDRHRRPTIQDIVNRLEETETKCNYAARKDWSLIFQPRTKLDKNLTEEAHRNTSLHYAPDPNDGHAQQIHHESTVDDESMAVTEALRLQMEVQKRLHEQLETQLKQGKYLEFPNYLRMIIEEQSKLGKEKVLDLCSGGASIQSSEPSQSDADERWD